MTLTYSPLALYDGGRCKICDTPAYAESVDAHVAKHVADGSGVVQSGRVVPTASVPIGNGWANLWDYGDGDTTYQLRGADWDALRAAYTRQKSHRRETQRAIRRAGLHRTTRKAG